jgi:hypothetical protein
VRSRRLGVDDAGTDSVDTDAVGGVVEGRRAGEADDAVLGRGVGRLALEALDPGTGGHVDDGAATVLPEHLSDLGPGAQEHAGEADPEDAVPVALGGVGRGLDRLLDARVVESGVQPSEAFDGPVDGGLDIFFAGDVAGERQGLAAVDLDEAGGLAQPVGRQIGESELRAGAGEGEGRGAADTRGGAGDECGPAPVVVGGVHAGSPFESAAVAGAWTEISGRQRCRVAGPTWRHRRTPGPRDCAGR